MAQWQRLSRTGKTLFLAVVLALLTLTAVWATTREYLEAQGIAAAALAASAAEDLRAPLPPPVQVFIQRTTAFPSFGNVLVSVQLAPEDLARKVADGTRDFVTIGFQDKQVILRDDGRGGDGTSGDGLFTGIGTVDDADLQARANADQAALASRGSKQSLAFMGRLSTAVESPAAFDLAGFQANRRVVFDTAVNFLEPETSATLSGRFAKGSDPARSPGGPQNVNAAGIAPVMLGTNLFQERVLIIRDLGVVNDATRTWDPCTGAGNPNGVWTFNHLITQMANQPASGIDPAVFVENWLAHWQANQTINTHVVPNRNAAVTNLILTPWPKRPDGHVDLAQSPFRLLAILPRTDLRRTTGGGGSYGLNVNGNFLDAGEARFVFGLVRKVGANCIKERHAVIFEYRVPKCECKHVKSWAQRWVDLFGFVPGTAAYNDRLQLLTDEFVKANANPTRPNGSALGQLRTNEITLGFPWELREFQLTQFPFSFLTETTSADTPIDAFNITAIFDSWVSTAVAPGLTAAMMFQNPIPPVPLFFDPPGAPPVVNFLGSNPQTPNTGFHWRVTAALAPALPAGGGMNITNWGRHRASLATCNGCHGRESRLAATLTPFVHVDPSTPAGFPARISEFMSGINALPDPQEPAGLPNRNFDDLARREQDINKLAKITCFGFHPINIGAAQASLKTSGRLPDSLFTGVPVMPPAARIPVGVDDMKRNLIVEVH
jgi:hypothetical protein